MLSKRLLLTILVLGATAISLFFVPWRLLWVSIRPLPDSVQEQVNRVEEYALSGIIVYIDEAGKPPKLHAAGWHNREIKSTCSARCSF